MTDPALMTPEHPDWDRFINLLTGPKGCNFRFDKKQPSKINWKCDKSSDRPLTCTILRKHFPMINLKETLAFFDKYGGYCDCEIIFNVEDSWRYELQKGVRVP